MRMTRSGKPTRCSTCEIADCDLRQEQMDAIAVAPKKKFLAAQAEACNEVKAATGSSNVKKVDKLLPHIKSEVKDEKDSDSAQVKVTDRSETSYSIRDNAPAGANAADSEEVLRFKNEQLFAALEVKLTLACK